MFYLEQQKQRCSLRWPLLNIALEVLTSARSHERRTKGMQKRREEMKPLSWADIMVVYVNYLSKSIKKKFRINKFSKMASIR